MKKLTLRLTVIVLTLAALGLADAAVAQDLHPSRRPSPTSLSRTFIGDAYVFVVYSRPYKRDRDNIFGTEESKALVPYGKLWRTGANEATQFTTLADLEVGGKTLAAGTYSVFTTPGADDWGVHFNTKLGLSGTGFFNPETREFKQAYDTANNAVDLMVKPAALAEDDEVDQFTISFEKTDAGAEMVLQWITTEVRVPLALAK